MDKPIIYINQYFIYNGRTHSGVLILKGVLHHLLYSKITQLKPLYTIQTRSECPFTKEDIENHAKLNRFSYLKVESFTQPTLPRNLELLSHLKQVVGSLKLERKKLLKKKHNRDATKNIQLFLEDRKHFHQIRHQTKQTNRGYRTLITKPLVCNVLLSAIAP